MSAAEQWRLVAELKRRRELMGTQQQTPPMSGG